MENETLQTIKGQIDALSTTLTQVIAVMPQVAAAEAACSLAIETQTQLKQDTEDGVPEAEIHTKLAVLTAYCDLLRSVASRD